MERTNFRQPCQRFFPNEEINKVLRQNEDPMWNYTKKVFRDPMVDSDEELGNQLADAIRFHRRNTKQRTCSASSSAASEKQISNEEKFSENKNYFSESNYSKISNSNSAESLSFSEAQDFNIKTDSCGKRKSIYDYTKQGAIPKNMFHKKTVHLKDLNKPLKVFEEINNLSNDSSSRRPKRVEELNKPPEASKKVNNLSTGSSNRRQNFRSRHTRNSKNTRGSNVNCQKNFDWSSKPFFYIVPKNPAPNFFFPQGTYFVLPKKVDLSLQLDIIVHPNNVTTSDGPQQKEGKNNLAQVVSKKSKKFGGEDLLCTNLNMNIQPLGEIENNLLEGNLLRNKKENREQLEPAFLNRNSNLKSFLERVCFRESSSDISSLQSSKKLYEKNLGIKACDVKTEKNKGPEDCSFAAFVVRGFEKIQNSSEEHDAHNEDLDDIDLHQIEIESIGGKNPFLQDNKNEEKKGETKASLSEEFSNETSETNTKIQTQLQRMTEALPEANFNELYSKCMEFEGNEELVTEYIEQSKKEEEMQQKLQNFLSVIPDADINFVCQEIEKLGNNDINNLICSLLESGNYPKGVESKNLKKNQSLWNIYVKNFSVEEFLLRVPHCLKFWDASDNNFQYYGLIEKFLQSRFPGISDAELQDVYESNDLNLVTTCSYFEKSEEPIRLAMTDFKLENFDEKFLQRITFIDHLKEIMDYLEKIHQKKFLEREEARLANAFLTCPLCTDNEIIPSEAVACPEGHVFCKSCIVRYVEVNVGDGKYKFLCPSQKCSAHFPLFTLQHLLPTNTYTNIFKKQQFEEINEANVEGLEFCHFCEFAYIPDSGDKIFKCRNPDCSAEICRECGELNHIPKRCQEIERQKDIEARKRIEESMTNKLLRTCPTCSKKFVKIDGCNKIVCVCGTTICYICRKKVEGYSHFKNYQNPLSSLCPLYSKNEDLHQNEVISEGIQTRNAIFQEDPDIHIINDPTVGF